jgi:hypothetical protein
VHVGDEADAAGIALTSGVVQGRTEGHRGHPPREVAGRGPRLCSSASRRRREVIAD